MITMIAATGIQEIVEADNILPNNNHIPVISLQLGNFLHLGKVSKTSTGGWGPSILGGVLTIFFVFLGGVESNSGIFRGGQSFLFTFRGGHDEIDLKCQ